MIEKIKCFYREIKNKVKKTPAYVKLAGIGDKVADHILKALLAFFRVVSPILTLLCTKTPDSDDKRENEIS